jgi:hypothetical protein
VAVILRLAKRAEGSRNEAVNVLGTFDDPNFDGEILRRLRGSG